MCSVRKISVPILAVCAWIFTSCANFGTLGGGPIDKTPPAVTKQLPADKTLQFSAKTIVMEFDEQIRLNSPENVLVTPFQIRKPLFTAIGNKLLIQFQDSLRANTTYVLNFLDLIGDNNENNRLKGFRYVFSTGAALDSGLISGSVRESESGKPIKEATVGLFSDTLPDTGLIQKKPIYITKTDSNGNFLLENLGNQKFRLLAFTDKNNNFSPDEGEDFAWPRKLVQTGDKVDSLQLVKVYPRNFRLTELRCTEPGKIRISFNQPVDTAWVQIQNKAPLFVRNLNDSLLLYYSDNQSDSLSIRVEVSAFQYKNDTLKLGNKKPGKDNPVSISALTKVQDANLFQPLVFSTTRPLSKVDTSKIQLFLDTLPSKEKLKVEIRQNLLEIRFKIEKEKKYKLEIPDSSVQDYLGSWVKGASIVFNAGKGEEDFAILQLSQKDSSKTQKIVQLLDAQGKVQYQKIVKNEKIIRFERLQPDSYFVRVVDDSNQNGKYDRGNYYRQEYPEKSRMSREAIKLRANWEMEQELSSLGL